MFFLFENYNKNYNPKMYNSQNKLKTFLNILNVFIYLCHVCELVQPPEKQSALGRKL